MSSANSKVENCCAPKPVKQDLTANSCCATETPQVKASFDWLLWGSLTIVTTAYALHLTDLPLPAWLHTLSHGVFELMNTMWWGVLIGALFVGLLTRIPQAMVVSVLGEGGSAKGLGRATLAGVMLDLCSHGILMVGMQLYQRGASLGQVMAFLIAS
ncbi:MAG: uncharacterized membrane protein YraQ (UPF0718 family), partial [Flavobacteriales bacterium]